MNENSDRYFAYKLTFSLWITNGPFNKQSRTKLYKIRYYKNIA